MILALCAMMGSLALEETYDHTFTLKLNRTDVQTVHVAGTFNSWNNREYPLEKKDGEWTRTVRLPAGNHQYKFVLNGTEWVTDPKVKAVDDGMGNMNSILALMPPGYEAAAARGDGKITPSGLRHVPRAEFLNYDQGDLILKVRTRLGDVQKVLVQAGGKKVSMDRVAQDELFETYKVRIPWNRKSPVDYVVELEDGEKTLRYGANGLGEQNATPFRLDPKTFKPFEVPNWVEDTVFYQIFPDRFENGDKSNDPEGTVEWGTKPTYWNWMGGDVAGVLKRQSHLKSLGVNGVYFNPIMTANSNHRYDPCDYFKVCPHFGTNEEFAKMTHTLHNAGIRVVLDQIYDHSGVKFAPFKDVLKNQDKSAYKDYFFIRKFPVEVKPNQNYEGWFGTEWMPKLNLKNDKLKQYLLDSTGFWMKKAKLSGWRLDVANEVPEWFWREFRSYVKQRDPNAWIVGEVWTRANTWLGGDQWDASMNYPFRYACLDFIAKGTISPDQFVQRLTDLWNWYPSQVSRNQMNLLSSHDTPRFLTDAGGDRRKQKLAAFVQLTWPGAPSIYYGEEIGMEGGADPDNRRPMDWTQANAANDMLKHYQSLIRMRKASEVIRKGAPFALPSTGQVAVYGVRYRGQVAVMAANRSDQAQEVTVSAQGQKSFMNGQNGAQIRTSSTGQISFIVPAWSGVALLPPDTKLLSPKSNHSQEK